MKEIIYPQRLKETLASKGDLSYIRTAYLDAPPPPPPPITCIPSSQSFVANPVNYNLVSMTDVIYQFYAIIETSDGERFFVRVEDDDTVIPREPLIGKLYYFSDETRDDYDYTDAPDADLTAAASLHVFLDTIYISTSGFNVEYEWLSQTDPYRRFVELVGYSYDRKLTNPPYMGGPLTLTKLDGLTVTSIYPDMLEFDFEDLDLRLNPNPYSFKFVHATPEDIQRYGIVNNSSHHRINIIDYANGGNEIEAFSCAQVGLPISPNHDNVSLISCVGAPTRLKFGLQNMYSLPDTSGTIQITDTVTGLTKKYIFKQLRDFFTNWTAIDFIRLNYPAYLSAMAAGEGEDEFNIILEAEVDKPENYFHPLKIIIQMNSPNALFTNNGTNRLAFCLNVYRDDSIW